MHSQGSKYKHYYDSDKYGVHEGEYKGPLARKARFVSLDNHIWRVSAAKQLVPLIVALGFDR